MRCARRHGSATCGSRRTSCPAPQLLDPLPTPLAHRVRGVAGGACINARAPPARVLRHMRGDALDATPDHETLVVERLVSANGLRLQAARALALEESERR